MCNLYADVSSQVSDDDIAGGGASYRGMPSRHRFSRARSEIIMVSVVARGVAKLYYKDLRIVG